MFEAARKTDYFDPMGICGSTCSSLAMHDYNLNKLIVSSLDDLNEFADEDSQDGTNGKKKVARKQSKSSHSMIVQNEHICRTRIREFARGRTWETLVILAVFIDVLMTILLLSGAMEDSSGATVLALCLLGVLAVDICLRLVADGLQFFTEKDRYVNIFELAVVIICFLMEVLETDLPVGLARLARPILRLVRIVRLFSRLALHLMEQTMNKTLHMSTIFVDVQCIYLEGIVGLHSAILKNLTLSRQPSLFQSQAVKSIIEFKWQTYARELLIKNLLVLLAHTLFWGAYAVVTYNDFWDDEVPREERELWHKDVLGSITLLFTFHKFHTEIRRFFHQGIMAYFSSIWNVISIVSCILLLMVLFLEIAGRHNGSMRSSAAVTTLMVWTHTIFFLKGFRGTGALVSMLVQIVKDMRYFLIIMIIMTVAFVQLFYILQTEEVPGDEPGQFVWYVYHAAWVGNYPIGWDSSWLAQIMFACMTLFMIIVLLNLLIAIMGNTYSYVNESAAVEFYFSLAELTHELEMMMTPIERASVKNFPAYILYTMHKEKEDTDEEEEDRIGTLHGTVNSIIEMQKMAEVRLNEVCSDVTDVQKKLTQLLELVQADTADQGRL
eukprot:gnl/TRDRNA2_/TRDRNA2_176673_c15_seq8.p1 gnl/TRDRNA2_/TRDRNA2_176673_c15~~gnl/TRDRNA2_/TRDRNA2_176673_c15_seq8.p1  ORF type:complete len:625 (-),score=101.30 gnl/TRDRNA2_/TRDRNA2_176673_c15_seq8:83-1909(-)